MTEDMEQIHHFMAEALLMAMGDNGEMSEALDQECASQTEKLRIIGTADNLDELETVMMFDRFE